MCIYIYLFVNTLLFDNDAQITDHFISMAMRYLNESNYMEKNGKSLRGASSTTLPLKVY